MEPAVNCAILDTIGTYMTHQFQQVFVRNVHVTEMNNLALLIKAQRLFVTVYLDSLDPTVHRTVS